VSFFETPSGERRGVQLTHENFTSGVTAIKSLFPVASNLSTLDTIVSAHSLSTPYGRAIAYTALFEGTSFATLPSTRVFHVQGMFEPEPMYLEILKEIFRCTDSGCN
jgi:long-chain acyl-CoA synthetase